MRFVGIQSSIESPLVQQIITFKKSKGHSILYMFIAWATSELLDKLTKNLVYLWETLFQLTYEVLWTPRLWVINAKSYGVV